MNKNNNLVDSITKIKQTLSLSDVQLSNIIETTQKDFKSKIIGAKQFNSFEVENLADYLDINPSHIVSGKIDYGLIYKRFVKKQVHLPSKYQTGALSRRLTIIYALQYINDVYGSYHLAQLFKTLQLDPNLFEDPHKTTNVLLLTDIIEYLKRRRVPDEEYWKMGNHNLICNKNGPLGSVLKSKDSVQEVYEYMVDFAANNFFDLNHEYNIIKSNCYSITFEAKASQQIKDLLKITHPGSKECCLYRGGAFEIFSQYINFPKSRVDKLSCMHTGDSSCIYKVTYDLKPHLLKFANQTHLQ